MNDIAKCLLGDFISFKRCRVFMPLLAQIKTGCAYTTVFTIAIGDSRMHAMVGSSIFPFSMQMIKIVKKKYISKWQ